MTPFEQAPNAVKARARQAGGPQSPVDNPPDKELVLVTGISGSGKASALKAFEDLGFHCVDNLPLELMSDFATLISLSPEIDHAAIVVDVREGATLDRLPEILKKVRALLHTRVVFLDAQDAVLVRRYSETRRPHPLGRSETVWRSIVDTSWTAMHPCAALGHVKLCSINPLLLPLESGGRRGAKRRKKKPALLESGSRRCRCEAVHTSP